MMNNTARIVTSLLVAATVATAWGKVNNNSHCPEVIDLAGQWLFSSDSVSFAQTISLPGTTDTNGLGTPNTDTSETTRLSRKNTYKGKAWYVTDFVLPKGKRQWQLMLERTKLTRVYVDGQLVGTSNDISTPQLFVLPALKPGKHQLMVMVDNSAGVPQQIYGSSHAYTEDTQTNWNGVIGRICLLPASASAIAAKPAEVHPAFRDFHIEGHHFYANGHKTFLRGKHDACVWPQHGHVAMTNEEWFWYLGKCKDYGINHIRFHSWCPPEAAFVAADSLGIYLQPELPFWGSFDEEDPVLMDFLHKEGLNILKWYGNHPSFVFMALGNELWGSIPMMAKFVEDFRAAAPDKLFTFGSNYNLGYEGVKEGMDYFTTCRVGGEEWGAYDTHTRGSFSFADAADGGVLNHFRPSTSIDLQDGCSRSSVPVISHETGQFQIYPDYREIEKYEPTVFRANNLMTFKQRLEDAGLGTLADAYHNASGRWSAQLYKADIELDLRTPSMAGYQLLDLQDYPGQGSAYVGILDAFMDNKGVCSQEEWNQWCSEIVPMFIADSLCYTTADGINGQVQIANYSETSLKGKQLLWEVTAGNKSVAAGLLPIENDEIGLFSLAKISVDLSAIKCATRLDLRLTIPGTSAVNSYPLWVYPSEQNDAWLTEQAKGIVWADTLDADVLQKLADGASVMLTPGESATTVGGLFMTDYWNYRMFRTICQNNKKSPSPGTMGILTNPDQPLFGNFPTDSFTSWQWYPVLHNSHPLVLDAWPKEYYPQVQVIDNIERNHKLGLVMECRVGKGRLLIVMSNLKEAAKYPEGRAFAGSMLQYMHSEDFQPQLALTAEQLTTLLTTPAEEVKMKDLFNITTY